MKILLKGAMFNEVLALLPEEEQKLAKEERRWGVRDDEKVKFDISEFSDASLKLVYDYLDARAATDRSVALSRGQVKQWIEIKSDPSGARVTKLENLPSAMKAYLATHAQHRYLFNQYGDGNFVPFFVSNIAYVHASEGTPAYVSVSLANINVATGRTSSEGRRSGYSSNDGFSLHHSDISGKTISEILFNRGYFVETLERMETYETEMKRYLELHNQSGLQMNVMGKSSALNRWYGHDFVAVERDGIPAKMVVDPKSNEVPRTATESKFWEDKKSSDEDKEPTLWHIPMHPYLHMFDLSEHVSYAVHVNNAEEYVYDTKIGEKLVLPQDVKDLLEILIEQASSSFEDIIAGKAGGAVILCQGVPGTGKTLTAEVYSEVMKRPLYKVQASQLGINIGDLEKRLQEVLGRAEKWGAILLLDEADVYVRSRGNEIEQNAIVGVFLRVLEYYKGVLFMTTNKGTEIDDAIVSRMTARITYAVPGPEERGRIWQILAFNNGVMLDQHDIGILVKELTDTSGRDIKNLLKLAKMVADKGGRKVTAALIKSIVKFKQ